MISTRVVNFENESIDKIQKKQEFHTIQQNKNLSIRNMKSQNKARDNLKIITETNTTNISNGSNYKVNESIEINNSDRPYLIDSISSRFG